MKNKTSSKIKLITCCLIVTTAPTLAVEYDRLNGRFDIGLGLFQKKVLVDHSGPSVDFDDAEVSPLIGFALNKRVSDHSLVGAKIEIQKIDGNLLTSFRALDYRYIIDESWQVGAFIGASRYDFRTPAYGYNLGFGTFYKPQSWKRWSFGAELQLMDKLARDKIHPDDAPYTQSTGPDTFTHMVGLAVTMSYHF
ncbi:hypothetical protein [Psychrosphaera haliotis]|uniref:Outer membrane beta-barrel protein n=1 Tax=Psychrosphaera haliotis TaxID=555083 RepID=A0A6N8F8U8_9GAMM|nr:hypothetical protein [Psychrosphaera haliotis]MUH71330.1 hypothetical protein [Psychrosphaera haliotis]